MGRLDWGQIIAPAFYILLIAVLAVFAQTGLQGTHGLAALREAEALEADLKQELAEAQAEHAAQQNLVDRLSSDYLDLDLLDERARAVLGYTRREELIIR